MIFTRGTEIEIIGVVKNFNFESLHNAIKPMAISLNKRGTFISVRVRSEDLHQSLTEIEAYRMRLAPAVPLSIVF
jgi:putative ABC transport system permease protein